MPLYCTQMHWLYVLLCTRSSNTVWPLKLAAALNVTKISMFTRQMKAIRALVPSRAGKAAMMEAATCIRLADSWIKSHRRQIINANSANISSVKIVPSSTPEVSITMASTMSIPAATPKLNLVTVIGHVFKLCSQPYAAAKQHTSTATTKPIWSPMSSNAVRSPTSFVSARARAPSKRRALELLEVVLPMSSLARGALGQAAGVRSSELHVAPPIKITPSSRNRA